MNNPRSENESTAKGNSIQPNKRPLVNVVDGNQEESPRSNQESRSPKASIKTQDSSTSEQSDVSKKASELNPVQKSGAMSAEHEAHWVSEIVKDVERLEIQAKSYIQKRPIFVASIAFGLGLVATVISKKLNESEKAS